VPTIEGAGVALAYAEEGTGPPLLIVHGLASGAAAWAPAARALAAAGVRVIAYDRRGYGASGMPEPYTATTVQEQAEDAAALLEARAGEPALLVGDGFGALIALDLLVRHGARVRGAVLREPPLFAFVPEATEVLARERQTLEDALRAGGPEHAVELWLAGRADATDLERARAAHRGFFADYGGTASWSVTRAQLRAVAAPVVVVTAPDTPAHVVAAADAAARYLPRTVRDGGGDVVPAVRRLRGRL